MYVCMSVCMYVCMCVCIYVHLQTYVHRYIYIYICILCVCVCVNACRENFTAVGHIAAGAQVDVTYPVLGGHWYLRSVAPATWKWDPQG